MVWLKISLGFFFVKVFHVHEWARHSIRAMIMLSVAWGLTYLLMTIFSCGQFNEQTKESSCGLQGAYTVVARSWSIFNAVTDMLLAALSVFTLWGAQMPRHQKVYVVGLLLFGTIGGVASIVRVVYIFRKYPDSIASASKYFQSAYWTLIEPGSKMILSCLSFSITFN